MTTAAPANPLARQLKRVWSQLPAGAMSERELDDAILRILGRYEGDYAHAGAVRAHLPPSGRSRFGRVTGHASSSTSAPLSSSSGRTEVPARRLSMTTCASSTRRLLPGLTVSAPLSSRPRRGGGSAGRSSS